MASVRLGTQNLAKKNDFSIDLVSDRDSYTYYIQISHFPSEATGFGRGVIQLIPLDPMDNTVLGHVSENTLNRFGNKADDFLKTLSDVLIKKLGAKQFIIFPEKYDLPHFTSPENSGFDRVRHASLNQLREKTRGILDHYNNFTKELDRHYHTEFMKAQQDLQRYQQIDDILSRARFTPEKMTEYKAEELQGKIARVKNQYIRPFVMLDEKGHIAGMVRILIIANECAYLSDEVVNQEIISYEKFPGVTDKEKKRNREIFLLAYLMHHVCQLLGCTGPLLTIAARDREIIYDQIGYQKFPASNSKVLMKFSPPGPVLTAIQDKIKSLPLPVAKPAMTAETMSRSCGYGKYFRLGALVIGFGLFAYRLCKGDKVVGNVNTLKPK